MMKFLGTTLVILLLLALTAAPTIAAATTFTQTFHNEPFPIFDPENPCNPAIGSGVVNGVFHLTVAGNGSLHSTITLTGSFDVLDLNSGQNSTGHFTFWAGQNINLNGKGQIKNSQTFTLNVQGKTEDGTAVKFNIVAQLREVDGVPTLAFVKAVCH